MDNTPPTFREALGRVLREERRRRGLALRPLAARAGLAGAYLGEVERGLKEASSETIGRLAAALEIPLAELLRRSADALDGADRWPLRADLPFGPDFRARLDKRNALERLTRELDLDDLGQLIRFGEFLASDPEGPS